MSTYITKKDRLLANSEVADLVPKVEAIESEILARIKLLPEPSEDCINLNVFSGLDSREDKIFAIRLFVVYSILEMADTSYRHFSRDGQERNKLFNSIGNLFNSEESEDSSVLEFDIPYIPLTKSNERFYMTGSQRNLGMFLIHALGVKIDLLSPVTSVISRSEDCWTKSSKMIESMNPKTLLKCIEDGKYILNDEGCATNRCVKTAEFFEDLISSVHLDYNMAKAIESQFKNNLSEDLKGSEGRKETVRINTSDRAAVTKKAKELREILTSAASDITDTEEAQKIREAVEKNDGFKVISDSGIVNIFAKLESDMIMGEYRDKNNSIVEELVGHFSLLFPMNMAYHSKHIARKMEELDERFPNFKEVNDFLKTVFFFQLKKGMPISIPQFVINGQPGIGKTEYCNALAEAVNIHSAIISIPSLSTAAELTGLASVWSNAQLGSILEEMHKGRIANPMIILDEIDKCVGTGGNSISPMKVLLSLTEERSSARFRSPPIKQEVNLSKVSYVCTCNNTDEIPPVMLSRMTVFNVPSPTAEQKKAIMKNIYYEAARKLNLQDEISAPSDALISHLCKESPRKAKRIINTMIMKAFNKGFRVDDKLVISAS